MMRFLIRFASSLRRLAARTEGNVLMMFVLSAIPVIIAVGVGVDIARAYAVKSHLGAALDAAGLAVGSSTGETNAQLQARLNQYFYGSASGIGNFPNTGTLGTPVSLAMTFSNNNQTIDLTASAQVPTLFMTIMGFSQITVAASSEIIREPTGLEVAVVLDNTGSMLDTFNGVTNMAAMTADAVNLVNDLFGSNASNPKLKMSIVPFVTAVNLGSMANSLIAANSLPTYTNGSGTHTIPYSNTNATQWYGCLEEPLAPADQQETTAAGAWTPYWWPTDPTNNPWGPTYPNNINIILTRPDSDNPSKSHSPNLACGSPITPLTMYKQAALNAMNAMQARSRSGTAINVGLVWGWRTLSPLSVFANSAPPDNTPNALAYGTTGWQKALILETDGTNNPNKCPSCNKVDYGAYGFLSANRLGTAGHPVTTQAAALAELDNRTAALCTAIKAKGIIIYTIGFTGSAANSQTLLQNCASDSSKYFFAPDQATLAQVFQTIGNSLNQLRVAK